LTTADGTEILRQKSKGVPPFILSLSLSLSEIVSGTRDLFGIPAALLGGSGAGTFLEAGRWARSSS